MAVDGSVPKPHRALTPFEFTDALVKAGVITPELREMITLMEIVVDPKDVVHYKFTVLADQRLYAIEDPKAGK